MRVVSKVRVVLAIAFAMFAVGAISSPVAAETVLSRLLGNLR